MIYEAIARGIWAALAPKEKEPAVAVWTYEDEERRFRAMHRRAQRAESSVARLSRRVARFEAAAREEAERARRCAECGGTGELDDRSTCVMCGGTGERDPLDDIFGPSGPCEPRGCR